MYLYLGSDVCVPVDDIIGIFDIEKVTVEKYMKEYLSVCQKSGKIYYVSLNMPKSFVVCTDMVYVTNVSCLTLRSRAEKLIS
ncbi:MAG: DUF370 domain-containing protein [Ruminiclostridium sp.]|nr:DUF370 domain-containing protein [Ruminiclostridium sp.]